MYESKRSFLAAISSGWHISGSVHRACCFCCLLIAVLLFIVCRAGTTYKDIRTCPNHILRNSKGKVPFFGIIFSLHTNKVLSMFQHIVPALKYVVIVWLSNAEPSKVSNVLKTLVIVLIETAVSGAEYGVI